MGDVGAVATLVDTVASYFMSENGYREFAKRRALADKKKEANDALLRNDWDAVRRAVDDLRRMSDQA